MEIFSMLLTLCAGNSLVIGEFPSQRPVTQSFDVLRLNKQLSKQSRCQWFKMPSRSLWRCNDWEEKWNTKESLPSKPEIATERSMKDIYFPFVSVNIVCRVDLINHRSAWGRNPMRVFSTLTYSLFSRHDDVIKWKHFQRNWPFVRGIHRLMHKGQWRGALMFSLICAWINN